MENLARELQTAKQSSVVIGLCQCRTPPLRVSPGELVLLRMFQENGFSSPPSSFNLFYCFFFN